jgi:hypothetical protein
MIDYMYFDLLYHYLCRLFLGYLLSSQKPCEIFPLDGVGNWPSVAPVGGRNSLFDAELCLMCCYWGVWCVGLIDCTHFCHFRCISWRWNFLYNRCLDSVIVWRGFTLLWSYYWYSHTNAALRHDLAAELHQILRPEASWASEILVFLWKLIGMGL